MAKGKKQDDGYEILEDPNAIVEKTNEFFDNKKNRTVVFGIGGIIALVVIAFSAYNYYITDRNNEAQEEMYQAQYYFEQDSLAQGLNGDGNSYGFLDIMDLYSGTDAANLANFYAGASYLRLGDYDGAIRYLTDFSSSDYLLQARAYALVGDAYMEMDDFSNAIGYYEDAAAYKPNASFTPVYLKKLAIAQEQNGSNTAAANTYSKIVKEYPSSPQIHDAKKNKARLEAIASE